MTMSTSSSISWFCITGWPVCGSICGCTIGSPVCGFGDGLPVRPEHPLHLRHVDADPADVPLVVRHPDIVGRGPALANAPPHFLVGLVVHMPEHVEHRLALERPALLLRQDGPARLVPRVFALHGRVRPLHRHFGNRHLVQNCSMPCAMSVVGTMPKCLPHSTFEAEGEMAIGSRGLLAQFAGRHRPHGHLVADTSGARSSGAGISICRLLIASCVSIRFLTSP